jgi:hypothetical protein
LEDDGLYYIGSGLGGGAGINGARKNRNGLRWTKRHKLGFVDISVMSNEIWIDFIQVKGSISEVVYTATIRRHKEKEQQEVALEMMLRNRLNADW